MAYKEKAMEFIMEPDRASGVDVCESIVGLEKYNAALGCYCFLGASWVFLSGLRWVVKHCPVLKNE